MTGAIANNFELSYAATFDPEHTRVWGTETIGSETATANFLWDEQNVVLKTEPGGDSLSQYTNEPQRYGNLVSQRQGTTSGFCHFDGLGSTSEISDSSQAIANKYLYTAFGIPAPDFENQPNVFSFVGQLGYQADNWLWFYIRRREYFPTLGRWGSRDLVITHPYNYVMNRPIVHLDPTGLVPMGVPPNCCAGSFEVNLRPCGIIPLDDPDTKGALLRRFDINGTISGDCRCCEYRQYVTGCRRLQILDLNDINVVLLDSGDQGRYCNLELSEDTEGEGGIGYGHRRTLTGTAYANSESDKYLPNRDSGCQFTMIDTPSFANLLANRIAIEQQLGRQDYVMLVEFRYRFYGVIQNLCTGQVVFSKEWDVECARCFPNVC